MIEITTTPTILIDLFISRTRGRGAGEAISTGARFNNPAAALSRIKVRQKQLDLPSRDEFLKFVEEIRTAGARQSKDCANLVRFLPTAAFELAKRSLSLGRM
jgi:hypothetical protein